MEFKNCLKLISCLIACCLLQMKLLLTFKKSSTSHHIHLLKMGVTHGNLVVFLKHLLILTFVSGKVGKHAHVRGFLEMETVYPQL